MVDVAKAKRNSRRWIIGRRDELTEKGVST
jgi:hypothetical protein